MGQCVDAIIVGGGLSGLTCAHYLHAAGRSFLLLEAASQVGGRVRTDLQDGYRLDRGFQVFLTSYPESQRVLDFDQLDLRPFTPGALIRCDDRFRRVADPWRTPLLALIGWLTGGISLRDGLALARWRKQALNTPLDRWLAREELSTEESLRKMGFSAAFRDSFFRPFLGGVFLDGGLETSSRMADFVFRMFCAGEAVLPAHGMQEIPRQIANRLPAGSIRCGAFVTDIEGTTVRLKEGEQLTARNIVIATQAPECRRLLYDAYPAEGRGVTCLYFAMDVPPHTEPVLVLNGTGRGPINNLVVLTAVSPAYAPAGRSLVSVSILGCAEDEAALEDKVRDQLEEWYGSRVQGWELLQSYRVRYALPAVPCPALQSVSKPALVRSGVFNCGDHCDVPSINGAMASGRRAAEAVIAAVQEPSASRSST